MTLSDWISPSEPLERGSLIHRYYHANSAPHSSGASCGTCAVLWGRSRIPEPSTRELQYAGVVEQMFKEEFLRVTVERLVVKMDPEQLCSSTSYSPFAGGEHILHRGDDVAMRVQRWVSSPLVLQGSLSQDWCKKQDLSFKIYIQIYYCCKHLNIRNTHYFVEKD